MRSSDANAHIALWLTRDHMDFKKLLIPGPLWEKPSLFGYTL
jgi:hypothetical protein